jgi:hypothetical protein
MNRKDKVSNSEPGLLLNPGRYFSEMVQDGCSKRNIKTYPAVQNYLVSVLEYYLDAKNLNADSSTLAEMYLQANNLEGSERQGLLKRLGDKTLYISGFFADSLSRKLVDVDYYADRSRG